MGYSGAILSTVTLRLLFCLALLALLPLRSWACAGVAGPAPTVAAQQASADNPAAADRATPPGLTSRAVSGMPEDHFTASCDGCQSCSQCHTPAVTSGTRLALGQALPQVLLNAARSAFSSTSLTPRLKPPIS